MTKRTLLVLGLAAALVLFVALPLLSPEKPAVPAPQVVTIRETAAPSEQTPSRPHTMRQAARKAMPSVLNGKLTRSVVQ